MKKINVLSNLRKYGLSPLLMLYKFFSLYIFLLILQTGFAYAQTTVTLELPPGFMGSWSDNTSGTSAQKSEFNQMLTEFGVAKVRISQKSNATDPDTGYSIFQGNDTPFDLLFLDASGSVIAQENNVALNWTSTGGGEKVFGFRQVSASLSSALGYSKNPYTPLGFSYALMQTPNQFGYNGSNATYEVSESSSGLHTWGNASNPPLSDLNATLLAIYETASPELTVTKSIDYSQTNLTYLNGDNADIVDFNADAILSVGDRIYFAIKVENSGNSKLADVVLSSETLRRGDGTSLSLSSIGKVSDTGSDTTDTLMDIGDVWIYSAYYTLTQDDINNGSISNLATFNATPIAGNVLVVQSSSTGNTTSTGTAVEANFGSGQLTVIKQFDVSSLQSPAVVGDAVSWTVTATNTGNTTLTNLVLADTLSAGGRTYTLTNAELTSTLLTGTPASVAPGDSVTWAVTYGGLRQDDIDLGNLSNTATVSADSNVSDVSDGDGAADGNGDNDADNDPTVTLLTSSPSLALVKTGVLQDDDGTAGLSAGDTIAYGFTVTNTGTQTLTEITLSDPNVTVSGGPIASLAPGATDSSTFTAVYTLTQADIDAGSVSNTAVATGSSPGAEDDVSDTSGTANDNDSPTVVDLEASASLALVKTGVLQDDDGTAGLSAGDTIAYGFTVTNTGTQTLTEITLSDPNVTVSGGPIASLAPGATDSSTFTAVYTLTQADIDAGSVSNTAVATGSSPGAEDDVSDTSGTANDNDSPTVVDLEASASLALVKTGVLQDDDGTAGLSAGDTIAYGFTVTNTGTQTLTEITLSDPNVTVSGGPIASLAPGATDSSTFTAVYTLTQADIDAGSVSNTAVATGSSPGAEDDVSDTSGTANDNDSPTVVDLEASASLALVKTGVLQDDDGTAGLSAGDTIAYGFTVTNTGTQTLTEITLSDPNVTVSGGPIASLAPGATDSSTFTAVYTLTQADIDAGSVSNTAVATGSSPGAEDDVSDTSGTANDNDSPTVVDLEASASLALVKTGVLQDDDGTAGLSAGDTIAYGFTVTNTGTQTLTEITLSDPNVTVSGGPIASLAPGATDSSTFTAVYTLTQADIDAGSVSNTAVATGSSPGAEDDVSDTSGTANDNDSPTVVDLEASASLALVKTGVLQDDDGTAGLSAGDTIAYGFTVTNTGTQTLTEITLSDPNVTVSGGPIASLAPGATDSSTFTAVYTLTQADIDAGSVSNTAVATGSSPGAEDDVSDTSGTANDNDSPTVVDLEASASLALVKTGVLQDDDGTAGLSAGDTIAYGFTVTNTGTQTLTEITLSDPNVTVSGGPIASLAPGATDSSTFTAVYTLTQADIDAGSVSNTAVATGSSPGAEDDVSDTSGTANDNDSPTVVDLEASASLALVKTGVLQDDDGTAGLSAGDTIAYGFTVTNTGTQTLTEITLSDPNVTVSGGPIASLAPGATDSSTFTAVYTLTQADIDAGSVSNTAVATGSSPGAEDDVSDTSGTANDNDSPTVVDLEASASLALVKTGVLQDDDGTAGLSAGDTIAYGFTVTNTGTQTLTEITLSDPNVTVSGGPIASLAPGATDSSTFTAVYTLTQADIDAGSVSNTAVATGSSPGAEDDVSDTSGTANDNDSPTVVDLEASASLALVKTGVLQDDDGTAGLSAGDTIAYGFTVTNTGTQTLTEITLSDPNVTVSGGPIASLAPGATDSSTFTAVYTLTQADIDAGSVSNTAVATGSSPGAEDDVSDTSGTANDNDSPTVVDLEASASLALVKTGVLQDDDGTAGLSAGDTIAYGFTVTNTGTQTLTEITLSDPNVTVSGGPIASLAPGATDSSTFTAVYTLTQADIDAGSVSNTAVATGSSPGAEDDVSDTSGTANDNDSPTVVDLEASASLALVKTGVLQDDDGTAGLSAGDTIAYGFTVTNTGTQTLTEITLSDPNVTVSGGPIASLAPGATDSSTFTAVYTLTQADIDAGSVSNTAVATGSSPGAEDDVSDTSGTANDNDSPTVVDLEASASLALVKTGVLQDDDGTAGLSAGDTIAYGFTVTNTGTQTLTEITLSDPNVTVSGGPIASLAPGATDSSTFTAVYTLTQADIDAGSVSNTAVATGSSPGAEDDVSDTSGTANDNDSPTVVDLEASASLALVKTGVLQDDDGTAGLSAGDTIAYGFTVTNTGTQTLTEITLSDPNVTVSGGPIASLAPGATDSSTFTAVYTLTQADIDAGSVSNTAVATGSSPGAEDDVSDTSGTANDNDSPTVVDLEASASLALVKTGVLQDDDGTAGLSAGDTIAYGFTVTNTGTQTLTEITLSDSKVTVSGDPIASLAPGATDSSTFTAVYTLTQADIDAGSVSNTAVATGSSPGAKDDVSDTSGTANDNDIPTVVDLGASASLALVKTGVLQDDDGTAGLSAGDTIAYGFTVTNTGTQTLTGITLSDSKVTVSGDPIASLAPGATDSSTFTAVYTLTQADIDAGSVSNTAVATGSSPGAKDDVSDTSGTANDNDIPTVTALSGNAEIRGIKEVALTFDADSSGGISAGDTLTFTITAINMGNVTLMSVGLESDTMSRGTTHLSGVTGFSESDFHLVTEDNTVLLPGETARFTATYVVTQDDVNAGGLSNTATVVGTTVTSVKVTDVTDDGKKDGSDTGDDPTTVALQPRAESDRSFGNEIGAPVSISVLNNDSYAGAVAPLVKLLGATDEDGKLFVDGEGVWDVRAENIVHFVPLQGFMGDPTPVEYVITSSNVAVSNSAAIYVDYLGVKAPDELVAADDEVAGHSPDGPVTLSPLENDGGNAEGELVRSTLRLLDSNNNKVTQLSAADEGMWTVDENVGTVTFAPQPGLAKSSVSVKYYVENVTGTPQTATIKILFIDPRGVVYDAETGAPISGVMLQFADVSGAPLSSSCLAPGQQPQRTGADGRYRFDLSVACTDLDGEEFQILISDAPGYALEPDINGKQAGPLDPGTPASETFEVVSYDAAPTPSQVRHYYMSFKIGSNSKQIVNNHIPLTSLERLIEDDLRDVLRDDLAATMTQQSRRMAGYASSALRRLQEHSPRECVRQIGDLLQRAPILFDAGVLNIQPTSHGTLDRIAALLANCDEFGFEVGVHTDDLAGEAFNLTLSQARALAVVSALRQRGVPSGVLSARGYGQGQPIADNDTEEGRKLNRRVEFTATGRLPAEDRCYASSESVRSIEATINQSGVTANGEFWRETRDCRNDGWNILEGDFSYLRTDQGTAQGMASLSYRSERFRTQDHLVGRFVGAYATHNDVTGLATGTIQGFGLNAGLYGARGYENGLYLDYYLGAAVGRHNFDLDFERVGGVITADGFYTYFAAFAGAAVSGETMLGDYKLMPRVGFEGAWSPGGDAEFDAGRGAVEQSGGLSTGEIAGLRLFGELRFDDVLPDRAEQLAITPMVFCDRPMGETHNTCGAGLSFGLYGKNALSGEQYEIELSGEKTETSEMVGIRVNYGRPLLGGRLSGTGSVARSGDLSIGMNYALDF